MENMQFDDLAPVDTDGIAMSDAVMVGWKRTRDPEHVGAVVAVRKHDQKWSARTGKYQTSQRLTLSVGELGVIHTEVPSACTHDTLRTIQVPCKLYSDNDNDDDDDDDDDEFVQISLTWFW